MLDNRETNSFIKSLILLAIFWTLVVAGILLAVTACGSTQLCPYPSETGDSGTQPIYEGGALDQYRCLRDPGGKAGIGQDIGERFQIWLDGTQLFNCYANERPSCPAHGAPPELYDCRTEDLNSDG